MEYVLGYTIAGLLMVFAYFLSIAIPVYILYLFIAGVRKLWK